jgi:hypothetical protein
MQRVKFEALAALNVKVAAFWDVAQCSRAENDRSFGGAYCLHTQDDESETSVSFYSAIQREVPEDSHLQQEEIIGN